MRTTKGRPLRLALGLLLTGVLLPPACTRAGTIVEAGGPTVWKYLDDGSEPDASWRQPDFDDSKWKSGNAPLGYGETRLGTLVRFGTDPAQKYVTTWFRRRFDAPQVAAGEHLVLLLCVDDGAVVYLNGEEVRRVNMPEGRVGGRTLANHALGPSDEGFYIRLPVASAAVRPGRRNVLAVEVHQAGAASSDLFFDLALKTAPASAPIRTIPVAAWEVTTTFHQRHYVGPGMGIPDGYVDGGRAMMIDAQHRATSGREILRVDRSRDVELARDLAFARSPALRALPTLERIRRIAARIDEETTPPGGPAWVESTTNQLEDEFRNQPILLGDWVDQGRSGVCRHRSLLFKILADEAGLEAALVRGNYADRGPTGVPHAWNEVVLDDGRRVLVDVGLEGSQPRFLEVSTPEVARHYLKVDDTPWYAARADRSDLGRPRGPGADARHRPSAAGPDDPPRDPKPSSPAEHRRARVAP